MTGVEQLHQEGITGEGITIAIIDSGVDYLHPALGGGFGPGFKVSGGRDLVGDDWEKPAPPSPDADPWTECTYHGTHVTGIAAGNDSSIGFVGVAPGAQIHHYRVAGCGRAPLESDIIIKAILEAYNNNADVISASISLSTGPFPDDPVSMLFTKIVEEGRTVCVVAAGNYGTEGSFTADAPASGPGVLSVGSVNTDHIISSRPRGFYRINGTKYEFPWAPATPGRFPESLPLRALSLDTTVANDACNPLRPDVDLSGSVILVRRGGCKFAEKMKNVVDAGGRYFLAYDNTEGALFEYDNDIAGLVGAGSLTQKTGIELVKRLAAGEKVEMMMDSNFTLVPYFSVANGSLPGGRMNGRSTWGPSGEANVMPSLAAPGSNVFSTFPRSWGGYGLLSGTSMAAPYVAGCVALVKQARPGLKASQIVNLLVSTAKPIQFSDGTNKTYESLAPVWQQGGGLVQPLAAVRAKVVPTVPSVSFNDTLFFTGNEEVTITNLGNETLVYTTSISPAAGVLSLANNDSYFVPWTRKEGSLLASKEFLETLQVDSKVKISIVPAIITIKPGSSVTATVRADVGALAALSRRCPLYGGYLNLKSNSSAAEALSIPYGGIGCALKDVVVLSEHAANGTYLTAATEAETYKESFEAPPISPLTVFTVPGPDGASRKSAEIKFPTVVLKLGLFSRAVTINLVSASVSCVKSESCGIPAFGPDVTAQPGGFNRVDTTYELWKGRLGNGSWAPEGDYKFRVCAMHAWGSLDDVSSMRDCIDTAPFTLHFI
ncbi:Peptidase S8/S53 subtilisin/kexin/sedolisin [Macrophomina phaseolina MS6]|uniref:Peptidase S8/S53 subtilisin/kexin/sedolisin n=1 Tax=Macrophomina phaseolina (strain MS6) TaxID=1126212 RepID=K2SGU6_MACPH|nr:Peptidase S8/S53 subtilisin/kexin/sedolisin [Macrophomina phaseolina MS6]